MVKLTAHIEGIGLLGPGLENWASATAILEGRAPYVRQPTVVPVPEGLPPAERRRLGLVVKLALGVGLEAVSKAGVQPDTLPAVFASSGGDGQNCHEICQVLANDERLISPTRFHNSVHNAAAGYWSIATRSKAASNALCAFDWSFAAGLLEAVTQVVVDQTRVLLVAYDAPYPQPLLAKRPIPEAFGVAFVLAPVGGATTVTLQLADAAADRMSNTDLEALRTSIPAARALPLLQQLATQKAGSINIEYLDGRSLAVEVEPCS
ncbi:MAG: beta-ketoacyl synthase chain length factor [Proteobacteria bacterium]|nr:beta-ketoacyl synthase chain length factor [Pseudomonadota bacterium]